MVWVVACKGPSGFSAASTAEEVTSGIDGTGLTAIVTGCTSGIGLETARVLALRGVHVVMAVRNVESGRKCRETILQGIPRARIDVMECDVSSLASVRSFATKYISSGLPLHILILNAGIMDNPYTLSKDGVELQFATNHLGHFHLTNLLLETMKNTARRSQREGRIVIVASDLHTRSYKEGIIFDRINDAKSYNSMAAYGQSKLANILHANELSRRLKEEGVNITVNSLHPGIIPSKILNNSNVLGVLINGVFKSVLKNVPQGAATTCYLALNPKVQGVSGEYFADCNISKPNAYGKDPQMAKKLWDFSMRMTASK